MNALGDAGESIGAFLIPVVSKLAGGLKTLANWFQNLSPAAQEWIVRIGAIVAAVGPALWIGGKLIGSFGKIGRAFSALSKLVAANPWVLLIAATVALVIIIVKNWDKIKEFLTAAWEAIKEVATKIWDGIKSAVSTVVDFLVNLFLNWTLPGLIIKHWDTIRDGALAVKDWVVDKFQALVDWFKAFPGKMWDAVKTIGVTVWGPIKDGATVVRDWVVEKFGAVIDFFRELPGKIGGFFGGLADTIKSPFVSAFNAIANVWNSTVGKLSFTIPSWIPGIGGKGWDVPDIPTFHNGGMFRAATPGGEGLAMLQDGERVTPAGGSTQPPIVIGNVYGWDDFVRKVRAAGVDINRLGMAG
jgi:phage-related protein